MIIRFFNKKSTGSGIKNEINKINNLQMNFINQRLENLEKGKVCSSFKDNILGSRFSWHAINEPIK